MTKYFEDTIDTLKNALNSIDKEAFSSLTTIAEKTLIDGGKIVVSGLGKNVPICEKIIGSLLSLGIDANFLHTNSAVHGDIGMVKDGDMVIVLSKSGNTAESIYLINLLKKRSCSIFGITFNSKGQMTELLGKENTLIISLDNEGDPWNIMPNNSSTINLIVLQALVMELAGRLNIQLDSFKKNHPGGAIGEKLRNE